MTAHPHNKTLKNYSNAQSRCRCMDLESHPRIWLFKAYYYKPRQRRLLSSQGLFPIHPEAWVQATAWERLAGASGVGFLRTAHWLHTATNMPSRNKHELPSNLQQLQNKVDSLACTQEYLQQNVHYKSNVEIFKLQPNTPRKELAKLVTFMA